MATIPATSAHTVPAMDVELELDDFMAQASDVGKSLNFNPNQQLLWAQVEGKFTRIDKSVTRIDIDMLC